MNETLKSNLASRRTWMRLATMVLFAIVFNVAELVVAFVVVAQFGFKLLTGEPNRNLAEFGDGLAAYFRQMIAFLTFRTEDRPFPFAPWPQASSGSASPPDAAPDALPDTVPDTVIET